VAEHLERKERSEKKQKAKQVAIYSSKAYSVSNKNELKTKGVESYALNITVLECFCKTKAFT